MRAIIKNNKKIVINQVDQSERALIDNFVRKSLKKAIDIRSLFDIDNELDGVSFEILNSEKPDMIDFKTPCIQVVTDGGVTSVDLEIDKDTTIEIDPDENLDYLEVSVDNKIILIRALRKPELMGNTGQYIVTAILNKEGCDPAIVPINVSVLYIDNRGGNYEELSNLPKVNNIVLIGNKSLSELGIQEEMDAISNSDIDDIIT